MISQARFHALDASQQAALHGLLHAGWPMDKALAIMAGRPPPQVGGARKYDDALSGYYKGMSDENKTYLTQLFYKKLKASVGQRGLYETMMADVNKPTPHPSWREVRAWHSAQRGSQLSRPLKAKSASLATVVTRDMLRPMRRVGCDTIVMQSTFADDRKMMDQGYKAILNIVDYATRRSFLFALRKTGDAAQAGRKFVEMIKLVRTEFYGDADSDAWPVPEMTVVLDGGGEFSRQGFRDVVEDELGGNVAVTFDPGQANNPNTNPVVENSNKQIRNVLRRIAQANRTTTQNDNKPSKDWRSYWYGPQGIYFAQMRQLVNERPDASLGRQQPIMVWNAYVAAWKERADTTSQAFRDAMSTVTESQDQLMKDADRRRGPSRVKPESYFQVGDIVRRENAYYSKDGLRSNLTKQGNRYSLSRYQIYSRQSFSSAPPIYELTLYSGTKPSDFKTRVGLNGTEVSRIKYSHDQLIRSIDDEDAPQQLMDNTPPPPGNLQVGDRVAVAWDRVREAGQNADTQTILYANLPQRLASGQLSAIRNDETWHEGEVTFRNTPQQWVRIRFDDGALATLSTNPNSVNYVATDKWQKI